MTTFDDREAAYENKFAHDAELEFLAEAARNKALAYWASELMGRSANEAAKYAKSVIRVDLEFHDEGVVAMLKADLGDKSDEATIRAKMAEFMEEARKKIIG